MAFRAGPRRAKLHQAKSDMLGLDWISSRRSLGTGMSCAYSTSIRVAVRFYAPPSERLATLWVEGKRRRCCRRPDGTYNEQAQTLGETASSEQHNPSEQETGSIDTWFARTLRSRRLTNLHYQYNVHFSDCSACEILVLDLVGQELLGSFVYIPSSPMYTQSSKDVVTREVETRL